jgi:hypothetical protein
MWHQATNVYKITGEIKDLYVRFQIFTFSDSGEAREGSVLNAGKQIYVWKIWGYHGGDYSQYDLASDNV